MLEAAHRLGFEAVGIEISPAASVCRERGYTVYEQPLHALRFPSNIFDVVTIIDVIEHMTEPRQFMQEVHRILKPSGLVLIMTPNVASWARKIMKGKWPHYKLEHILYFNPHSLYFLLSETGFEVGSIGSGFKYLNLDYVVRHFQTFSGGGMTWGLASYGLFFLGR